MERRALAGKCGEMYACRAALGKDEWINLHVCVDVTVLPFGIVTMIGLTAGCLFVCGGGGWIDVVAGGSRVGYCLFCGWGWI